LRLIENRIQKTPVEIGGQKFDNQNPLDDESRLMLMTGIEKLLNTKDLGRYDVVVGEMQMSPTMQLAYFSMFSEMAAKGLPIPPSMIIKLSPLPEKEKQESLKAIEQQMNMQAEQEKMKYDTEIQKTILSKTAGQPGGIPGAPQEPMI
jgi:hypothetical protein